MVKIRTVKVVVIVEFLLMGKDGLLNPSLFAYMENAITYIMAASSWSRPFRIHVRDAKINTARVAIYDLLTPL